MKSNDVEWFPVSPVSFLLTGQKSKESFASCMSFPGIIGYDQINGCYWKKNPTTFGNPQATKKRKKGELKLENWKCLKKLSEQIIKPSKGKISTKSLNLCLHSTGHALNSLIATHCKHKQQKTDYPKVHAYHCELHQPWSQFYGMLMPFKQGFGSRNWSSGWDSSWWNYYILAEAEREAFESSISLKSKIFQIIRKTRISWLFLFWMLS